MIRTNSLTALFFLALAAALPLSTPALAAPPKKEMLVVAPRQFHAALEEFVAYKKTLLPTELVALEDALEKSQGVDDPEKLKRYFYRHWKENHLGYVLLVGSADVMAIRYMVLDRVTPAAFDYAFYPSDLYYADLAKADGSFDDWNADKAGFHAGYFGEVHGEKNKDGPINHDRIHYLPDIGVGRWPARNAAQVATIAAKSIRTEKATLAGTKPGQHTAALVSVGGWVDSRPALDSDAKALGADWHLEHRYYGRGKPPTAAEVTGLLRSGVGLLLHAGHGDSHRWEGCCDLNSILKVSNGDRLPVMVSAGCSTATFAPLPPYEAYTDIHGVDHQGTNHGEVFTAPPPPPSPYQRKHLATGLGVEVLVRGETGAVAYIGCNTGSQPCGLTLVAGFAQGVGRTKEPRLGDAWADAVRYYYAHEHLADLKPNNDWYPPSIFFQAMKFMVFGDPSLRLTEDPN